MSTLMKASHQWATRPDDQRFIDLRDMLRHFETRRGESAQRVVPTKALSIVPDDDNRGIELTGPTGNRYAPTHWAFGQLTQIANIPGIAPNGLRQLPSPLAADVLNFGLQFKRDVQDVGVLLHKNGTATCQAVTGPKYGRIWNSEILQALVGQFGNGRDGTWKVPGEFGQDVAVTKANTTLFAGDRDMFVFLCDEKNRVEVPNRRKSSLMGGSSTGSMARGFFMWNSEVGKTTFGLGMFLFDYVCCNRIVWGAEGYQEIRVRHTSGAPERFVEEIQPALLTYANSATTPIVEAIANAQKAKLDNDLDNFLATRFGKSRVEPIKAVHMLEEQRPIETAWDAVTAATAYARSVPWQDDRVLIEREAGKIIDLVAA